MPGNTTLLSETAIQYTIAVLKGATSGLEGIVDTIMHPLDNVVYPLSDFVFDATILLAAHSLEPEGEFALLHQFLQNNPELYNNAVLNMEKHVNAFKQAGIDFKAASGPKKAEVVSELLTEIFVPGGFIRSTIAATKAAKNLKTFGRFTEPPKFHVLTTNDIPRPFPQFNKLSVDVVRADKSGAHYLYVITTENELIISRRRVSIIDRWENKRIYRIMHPMLGKLQPVFAAGELVMKDGKILYIDDLSGHYQPVGNHLPNLVESAFVKAGFSEAKDKFLFGKFPAPAQPIMTQQKLKFAPGIETVFTTTGAITHYNHEKSTINLQPNFPTAVSYVSGHNNRILPYGVNNLFQQIVFVSINKRLKQIAPDLEFNPYQTASKIIHPLTDDQQRYSAHLISALKATYDDIMNVKPLTLDEHHAFQDLLAQYIPDSQLTSQDRLQKNALRLNSLDKMGKLALKASDPKKAAKIYQQWKKTDNVTRKQGLIREELAKNPELANHNSAMVREVLNKADDLQDSGCSDTLVEQFAIDPNSPLATIITQSASIQEALKLQTELQKKQLTQTQLAEMSQSFSFLSNIAGAYGQKDIQKFAQITSASLTFYQGYHGIQIANSPLDVFTSMSQIGLAFTSFVQIMSEPEQNSDAFASFIQQFHQGIMVAFANTRAFMTDTINERIALLDEKMLPRFNHLHSLFAKLGEYLVDDQINYQIPLLETTAQIGNAVQQLGTLISASTLTLLLSEFDTLLAETENYTKRIIQQPISTEKYIQMMGRLAHWATIKAKEPLFTGQVFVPVQDKTFKKIASIRSINPVLEQFQEIPHTIIHLLAALYAVEAQNNTPLYAALANPTLFIRAVNGFMDALPMHPATQFDRMSGYEIIQQMQATGAATIEFIKLLQHAEMFFQELIRKSRYFASEVIAYIKQTFAEVDSKSREAMDRQKTNRWQLTENCQPGVWCAPILTQGDIYNILQNNSIPVPAITALAEKLGFRLEVSYKIIQREESDLFCGIGEHVKGVHRKVWDDRGWDVYLIRRSMWNKKVAELKQNGLKTNLQINLYLTSIAGENVQIDYPSTDFNYSMIVGAIAFPAAEPDITGIACLSVNGEDDGWCGARHTDEFHNKITVHLWNHHSPVKLTFPGNTLVLQNGKTKEQLQNDLANLTVWMQKQFDNEARKTLQQYLRMPGNVDDALVMLDYYHGLAVASARLIGLDPLPLKQNLLTRQQIIQTLSRADALTQLQDIQATMLCPITSSVHFNTSAVRALQRVLRRLQGFMLQQQIKPDEEWSQAIAKEYHRHLSNTLISDYNNLAEVNELVKSSEQSFVEQSSHTALSNELDDNFLQQLLQALEHHLKLKLGQDVTLNRLLAQIITYPLTVEQTKYSFALISSVEAIYQDLLSKRPLNWQEHITFQTLIAQYIPNHHLVDEDWCKKSSLWLHSLKAMKELIEQSAQPKQPATAIYLEYKAIYENDLKLNTAFNRLAALGEDNKQNLQQIIDVLKSTGDLGPTTSAGTAFIKAHNLDPESPLALFIAKSAAFQETLRCYEESKGKLLTRAQLAKATGGFSQLNAVAGLYRDHTLQKVTLGITAGMQIAQGAKALSIATTASSAACAFAPILIGFTAFALLASGDDEHDGLLAIQQAFIEIYQQTMQELEKTKKHLVETLNTRLEYTEAIYIKHFDALYDVFRKLGEHLIESQTKYTIPTYELAQQTKAAVLRLDNLVATTSATILLTELDNLVTDTKNYFYRVSQKPSAHDYNDRIIKLAQWATHKAANPLLTGQLFIPTYNSKMSTLESIQHISPIINQLQDTPHVLIYLLAALYAAETNHTEVVDPALANPVIFERAAITYLQALSQRPDLNFDSEHIHIQSMQKTVDAILTVVEKLQTDETYYQQLIKKSEEYANIVIARIQQIETSQQLQLIKPSSPIEAALGMLDYLHDLARASARFAGLNTNLLEQKMLTRDKIARVLEQMRFVNNYNQQLQRVQHYLDSQALKPLAEARLKTVTATVLPTSGTDDLSWRPSLTVGEVLKIFKGHNIDYDFILAVSELFGLKFNINVHLKEIVDSGLTRGDVSKIYTCHATPVNKIRLETHICNTKSYVQRVSFTEKDTRGVTGIAIDWEKCPNGLGNWLYHYMDYYPELIKQIKSHGVVGKLIISIEVSNKQAIIFEHKLEVTFKAFPDFYPDIPGEILIPIDRFKCEPYDASIWGKNSSFIFSMVAGQGLWQVPTRANIAIDDIKQLTNHLITEDKTSDRYSQIAENFRKSDHPLDNTLSELDAQQASGRQLLADTPLAKHILNREQIVALVKNGKNLELLDPIDPVTALQQMQNLTITSIAQTSAFNSSIVNLLKPLTKQFKSILVQRAIEQTSQAVHEAIKHEYSTELTEIVDSAHLTFEEEGELLRLAALAEAEEAEVNDPTNDPVDNKEPPNPVPVDFNIKILTLEEISAMLTLWMVLWAFMKSIGNEYRKKQSFTKLSDEERTDCLAALISQLEKLKKRVLAFPSSEQRTSLLAACALHEEAISYELNSQCNSRERLEQLHAELDEFARQIQVEYDFIANQFFYSHTLVFPNVERLDIIDSQLKGIEKMAENIPSAVNFSGRCYGLLPANVSVGKVPMEVAPQPKTTRLRLNI